MSNEQSHVGHWTVDSVIVHFISPQILYVSQRKYVAVLVYALDCSCLLRPGSNINAIDGLRSEMVHKPLCFLLQIYENL